MDGGRSRTQFLAVVALLIAKSVLVLATPPGLLGVLPLSPSGKLLHGQIYILGDGGFNATNGVASGSGTASDPYVIQGWEIGEYARGGITISGTRAHFIIRGVYLHGQGLSFSGISNGTVVDSTISQARQAINIDESRNMTLSGNTVSVREGDAVRLWYSRNITLVGNVFTGGGLFIYGSTLSDFNSHAIALNNLVNGRPLHYHKDCFGLDLARLQVGELIVANCASVLASDLTIGPISVGVELAYASHATVANVTISSTTTSGPTPGSLNVYYSTNVTLKDNVLSGEELFGVYLASSKDITIQGNTIMQGRNAGIDVEDSKGVSIMSNLVRDEGGIRVAGPSYESLDPEDRSGPTVQIFNNVATRIGSEGVGALAYHNDLSQGKSYYYGNLDQSPPSDYLDSAPPRIWDDGYPRGGNYWPNSTYEDRCRGPRQDICDGPDGIADSPFVIDANNRDDYPLTGPSSSIHGPVELVVRTDKRYFATGEPVRITVLLMDSGTEPVETRIVDCASFQVEDLAGHTIYDHSRHTTCADGPRTLTLQLGQYFTLGQFAWPQVDDSGRQTVSPSQLFIKGMILGSAPAPPAYVKLALMPRAPFTAWISPATGGSMLGSNLTLTAVRSGGVYPFTYSWSLGDGNTSREPRPTHRFDAPGRYNVSLLITDAEGNTRTSTATIDVVWYLGAGYYQPSGSDPLTLQFVSNPSGGKAPYNLTWDFGDGSRAWGPRPLHTFSKAGRYRLEVTVTDAADHRKTETFPLTVPTGPHRVPPFRTPVLTPAGALTTAAGTGICLFLLERRRRRV